MKEILVLGGGGVGTMAAVNLQCGQKAAVTMVLRSNYNRAVEDGYHITSVDHGEIVGWRPTTGKSLYIQPNMKSCPLTKKS